MQGLQPGVDRVGVVGQQFAEALAQVAQSGSVRVPPRTRRTLPQPAQRARRCEQAWHHGLPVLMDSREVLGCRTLVFVQEETTLGRLSGASIFLRSLLLALLLFGSVLPYGGTIQAVASGLIAPVVVYEVFRSLPALPRALKFIVPLFGLLALPGLWVPINTAYGHQKFLDLMTLSLFTALAVVVIRDMRHLLAFAKMWVLLGVIVAAVILAGSTGEGGIAGRAIGFGANPIGLARATGSALVVTFWFVTTHRLSSMHGAVLGLFLMLGLFATGSKGPMMAVVLAVAVIAVADPLYRLTRVLYSGAAVVGLYLLTLEVPALRESRLGLFLMAPGEVSDPIRSEAIHRSLLVISKAAGITGYGSWSSVTGMRKMDYPHNIWLELAVEGGPVIGSVFALTVLVTILRLLRRKMPAALLFAALIVFEAVSVSLSGDLRARTFFFFLTMGWVVIRWPDEAQEGTSDGSRAQHLTDHGCEGKPLSVDDWHYEHGLLTVPHHIDTVSPNRIK